VGAEVGKGRGAGQVQPLDEIGRLLSNRVEEGTNDLTDERMTSRARRGA
jgi:hypothetical protein